MADTQQTSQSGLTGPAAGKLDTTLYLKTTLQGLLTPEGLEKNLDLGFSVDTQSSLSIHALMVYFAKLGMFVDLNQIKPALEGIQGTSVSEDAMKVFINLPTKRSLVQLNPVPAMKQEALKSHISTYKVKPVSEEPKDKEQSLYVRFADDAEASAFLGWFKSNPLQGLELKATIVNESFTIYLRTRYRTQYIQFEKQQQGFGLNAMQAQYQMMMSMFMMSMYQNPQGQSAMMQLLASQGALPFPGGPGSITHNRNLYVRKAKDRTGEPSGEVATHSGPQSSRGKGGRDWESKEPRGNAHQHSNKKEKRNQGASSSGAANEKKTVVDKEIEPIGRTRLDSDSFPPISGTKKHIPTEGFAKSSGGGSGQVTRQFIVEFFEKNKDHIKIHPTLLKFNLADVPIIDPEAELRVEEINPTPRKEYHGHEREGNSGPTSRKGSVSYRKTSFNAQKNHGAEDEAGDHKA